MKKSQPESNNSLEPNCPDSQEEELQTHDEDEYLINLPPLKWEFPEFKFPDIFSPKEPERI